MKLISLEAKHFAMLAIGVLCISSIFLFVAGGSPTIEAWYYEAVVAPDVQRKLGFETGLFAANVDACAPWGIVSVLPGGAFDRAGVRAGDIPWGRAIVRNDGTRYSYSWWFHGQQAAIATFYSFLARSRGNGEVEFVVQRLESSNGKASCPERRVAIEIP